MVSAATVAAVVNIVVGANHWSNSVSSHGFSTDRSTIFFASSRSRVQHILSVRMLMEIHDFFFLLLSSINDVYQIKNLSNLNSLLDLCFALDRSDIASEEKRSRCFVFPLSTRCFDSLSPSHRVRDIILSIDEILCLGRHQFVMENPLPWISHQDILSLFLLVN